MEDANVQNFNVPAQLSSVQRSWSLAAIIACISVAGMGLGLTLPLLALTMESMGVPSTLIGLNAAMTALATLTFSPLVPHIFQRIGAVKFLYSCLGITIICLLSFKAFPNIWFWFPIRYVLGACLSTLFVVTEVWINQLATSQTRGRLIGLYGTSAAAGFGMGPMILWLVGSEGWAPYLLGSFIVALAAIPIALARQVSPEINEKPNYKLLALLAVAPAAIMGGYVMGALESSIFNFLPIYGVRTSLSEATAPLLLTTASAGNVLLQFPIGWLTDKYDKRLILGGCAVLGCAGALAFPLLISNLAFMLPVLFVWGGVIFGMYTAALVMIGERFRGAELAGANAAIAMMWGLGSLTGPALGGIAMDIQDPHGFPAVLALISGCFAIFVAYRYLRE